MKVIFIGDVVGRPGRQVLKEALPVLIKRYCPELVIANGENAAGGAGITKKTYLELVTAGVDVVTGGNHSFDRKEARALHEEEASLLRPDNLPQATTPGRGAALFTSRSKNFKIAVINLQGQVFMRPIDCPFQAADRALLKFEDEASAVIVDFHAEATSEKQALGWYLDGRASAVLGTHSHVQTADERILDEGTAYLSDVGMSGLYDSVLGVDKEGPLKRFTTALPHRLTISQGRTVFNAALLHINSSNGKTESIQRIFQINK